MSAAKKHAPLKSIEQVLVSETSVAMGNPGKIAVGSSLEPATLVDQYLRYGYSHICQQDGHEFARELRSSELMIKDKSAFKNFPIASILTPDDLGKTSEEALTLVDFEFSSSTQKREALVEVGSGLDSIGLSKTLAEDIIGVADEMFTNAIYNAPFVDGKTHVNPGVSRHNFEIRLEKGKHGRLLLAHDESRLVIGCEDRYGSLSLRKYVSKIKATLDHGAAATMNFGSGGAGLGSYIIFNSGCSLYVGVWPGEATIFCCVIPLGMSNRKRIQLAKNLHLIQG